MVRAVFSIITTLLAVGAAARSTGLSPLRSLKFFCVDRWLQPQCTTQRLQIAAVASLRGGGGDGEMVNVVCTLRGKKYDVSASTVADVWAAVEDQAGLEAAKQGVIFKGKKLSDGDQSLADAGISEGDTVNIVPQKKASSAGEAKSTSSLADVLDESDDDDDDDTIDGLAESGTPADALAGMSDEAKEGVSKMLEDMGGQQGLKDMMKQMGLDGPMTPDKIETVMNQIKGMFNNPAIAQLFNNPEILEQSRQHILNNPMMMDMYDKMGMGALIRDPETFKKQMESMKTLMENPDAFKGAMQGLSDSKLDQFDDGEL